MAQRAFVLAHDTWLYHPTEGKRLFPAGETDPGGAWSDSPGGDPAGAKTVEAAMAEVAEANTRIEALGRQLERQQQANFVLAQERDLAVAKAAIMAKQLGEAEQALAAQVPTRAVPDAPEGVAEVMVPSNWESQPFLAKRALARRIAGHNGVSTKDEVAAEIRRHLGLIPA